MIDIKTYKEVLRVVHNEYVDEIQGLEETLEEAYSKGWIPTHGRDKEACIAEMKATLKTAAVALRMHMDRKMEELNEI